MKVFIHYEDNSNEEFHKTSKITLPKKWLDGPVKSILELFVNAYNPKFETNPLNAEEVHIETDKGEALSNECVVSTYIPESADIYVKHGPPPALAAVTAARLAGSSPSPPAAPPAAAKALPGPGDVDQGGLVLCKRFGCQKKYDPTANHSEACSYHKLPPVFHETVKFWACCPEKKCYSWDAFMGVKGCELGEHTNAKPDQPSVLGGVDVRSGNDGSDAASAERLKTIEEYNAERKQPGGDAGSAIAKMYALRQAMDKAGIPGPLFDAAKDRASERLGGDHVAVAAEMASRITALLGAMRDE